MTAQAHSSLSLCSELKKQTFSLGAENDIQKSRNPCRNVQTKADWSPLRILIGNFCRAKLHFLRRSLDCWMSSSASLQKCLGFSKYKEMTAQC